MNKTLNSYNSSAGKFNEKFSTHVTYQKQILNFIDFLKPGSCILDMGCGSGLNSKLFSEAGHRVHGFDFSSSMIEIAKENCPHGNFSVSTIHDFESDMKFDAACMSFIIVHLENSIVESVIQKTAGLIKQEGLVYISFMTGKQPGYETTSFSETEIYFNYFEPDYIEKLLNENGFSVIFTDTAPYTEPDGSITEDIFMIFRKQ